MALAITKLSDSVLNRDTPIRALVYGPAGAGKTTLVGTFPTPMLIFDFDQKLKPLYGKVGIDVLSYTMADIEKSSDIFNQFKRDFKEAKKSADYKTLVIDSLSSLDTLCLRHFVKLSGKASDAPASLPVYQEQGSWYSFFFTDLKSVTDKHVLVTAHEFYNVDGESGIHSIQPLITGKAILGKLPSLFEEVWYMKKMAADKDDSTLFYRNSGKAMATSTMLHGGNGKVENPSFEKILTQAKGGK